MATTTTENDRRVKAFPALVRYAEANQREDPLSYNVKNDGTYFFDMSQHPGPKEEGQKSSAAGAYQILYRTYRRLIKEGCPKDFSNQTQDEMALRLIYDRGALPLIWAGHLPGAFSHLTSEWISLPGGKASHLTEDEAEAYFWKKVKEYAKEEDAPAVRLDGDTWRLNHHNPRTR